jgi:outer membrane protein assembly factor BamD
MRASPEGGETFGYTSSSKLQLESRFIIAVRRKIMPVIRTLQLFLLAVLAASALTGCGRRDNVVRDGGPTKLYDQGKKAMDATDFPTAIKSFQALQSRYPFSPETRQAQLDLIYLYYKGGQPEQAVDAAEAFERENPTHPRVDYCMYMRGRVYFDQEANFLEKFFRVDMSRRPPKDTMKSYSTFEDMIRRFPNSEYVPDARQRMVYLRNRLARFENYVAEYYINRGAYVAAINRTKYALEHYPGAPELEKTMQIQIAAYEKLGMQDLATDAKRVYAATWGGQQNTRQAAQPAPAAPAQQAAQATSAAPTQQQAAQAAPAPSSETEPDTRASAN